MATKCTHNHHLLKLYQNLFCITILPLLVLVFVCISLCFILSVFGILGQTSYQSIIYCSRLESSQFLQLWYRMPQVVPLGQVENSCVQHTWLIQIWSMTFIAGVLFVWAPNQLNAPCVLHMRLRKFMSAALCVLSRELILLCVWSWPRGFLHIFFSRNFI